MRKVPEDEKGKKAHFLPGKNAQLNWARTQLACPCPLPPASLKK
jgi:hypothetical protein